MNVPEPSVRVVAYEVSCVPRDDVNARPFTITVRHVRDDLWIATDGFFCLNEDGVWVQDPSGVYNRHNEQTAMRLAVEAAPRMNTLGWTVSDALAARSSAREERDRLSSTPAVQETEVADV